MKKLVLRIELTDSIPEVYREIVIAESATYQRLASVIDIAFGWNNEARKYFVMANNRRIITNDNDKYQEMKQSHKRYPSRSLHLPHCFKLTNVMLDQDFKEEQMLPVQYIRHGENEWQHTITLVGVLEEESAYAYISQMQGSDPSEYSSVCDFNYEQARKSIVEPVEMNLKNLKIRFLYGVRK